jgi:hypothetical protein
LERGVAFGQKLPIPSYPGDLNKLLAVGMETTGTLQEPSYTLISRAGEITTFSGVNGAPTGALFCDGSTLDSTANNNRYLTLWGQILNQYGVGTDGFFGIASANNLNSIITNQYSGAVTAAADVSTTMTITTPTAGDTGYFETVFETSYPITLDSNGARTASSTIYLRCLTNGSVTTPVDFNTTMTMGTAFPGSATWKADLYITAVAGSAIPAGSYFSIYNPAGTHYAVWFRVSGVGSAPTVPGATLIRVNILTGDTAVEVANKTLLKLSGNQVTNILAKAATSIPAGSYFNINTNARQWYVWFTVDGAGTDPAPTGRTAIPVTLLSSNTAAQVQAKITAAIPAVLFKIPNINAGFFTRGGPVSPTNTVNPDFADANGGNTLGSTLTWQVQSHTHTFNTNQRLVNVGIGGSEGLAAGSAASFVPVADNTGGNQTNPVYTVMRYIIYY